MFKEMVAKKDMARSEEWEREESVSDEEMARRFVIGMSDQEAL